MSAIKKPTTKKTDKGAKENPKKIQKFRPGMDQKKKFSKFGKKPAPKPGTTEKNDWQKFKKDKKDLKMKRKQTKKYFDVSTEAKQIYEKLKCKATPNKDELVDKLFSVINGGESIRKIVMAHDTSRIVQCLLKHAKPKLREQISEELIPIISEMSTSKYAVFCVKRMLKYGNHSTKQKLIDALMGNVVKLTLNAVSSSVIDIAYTEWATNKQKSYMRQEFYGEIYKKNKEDTIQQMSDAYKIAPEMKNSILASVKSKLEHAANKSLVDNSLIHTVLNEFLGECSEEDRNEIIAVYSPLIPQLASTRCGSLAAITCFWHSQTKDRRAIVKSLKEHLEKLCTHEHGHVVILAIINSMDDTKATKKAIFDHIYPNIENLLSNHWGRQTIEWFISPGDKEFFHPQLIEFLNSGLKYSKKDQDIRWKEIHEQIEEPLANSIAGNPEFWLSDGHMSLVTACVLKNLKSETFSTVGPKLAETICDVDWTVNVRENEVKSNSNGPAVKKAKKVEQEIISMKGIEDAGVHIALKKILRNDKQKASANEPCFSSFILDSLTTETIDLWISLNRGCFILLNMFENGHSDCSDKLKSRLGEHRKQLKQQSHTGAKLILEKVL